MSWRSPLNAEIYDEFTREHGLYPFLNRELAARLELESARRVLDLACGTGATALACLGRLPRDSELVGVDASQSMVAVARRQVPDPRARFLVSPAELVAEALADEPLFDRCACNAAFWQFPRRDEALAGVARLLEPGGLFAFNVPAERVAGETPGVHSFQAALSRALVAATGRPLPPPTQLLDLGEIRRTAEARGLAWLEVDRLSYHCRQGELVELMKVPALIGPLVVGLADGAVGELLEQASRAVDLEEEVELPWLIVRLRRS